MSAKNHAATKAHLGNSESPPPGNHPDRVFVVQVDPRLCKGTQGCGICIAVCPAQVLESAPEISPRGVHPAWARSPEHCTGCEQCMLHCPDLAIVVARRMETEDRG